VLGDGENIKHSAHGSLPLTDDDIEAAKAMLANPDIGVTQIAHRLGVSPATLYRYIPAARTANTSGV
jgi:AcrR family transcriptional regulator